MDNYSLCGKSLIDLTKQGGNARHTRNRHGRQSAVRISTEKRRRTRATKKTGNRQGDNEKQSGQSAIRFNIEPSKATTKSRADRIRQGTSASAKIKSTWACHPPTQQKYAHHHHLMIWCIKGT